MDDRPEEMKRAWVCLDPNCDFITVQDEEPDNCPECLERGIEVDDQRSLMMTYHCPYCRGYLIPESPDECWYECPKCGFTVGEEWFESTLKKIYKRLEFYKARILKEDS